jgi:hypothetical protein
MIRLNNCRAASFFGIRVNLAGRTIAAAEGSVRPRPAYVFEVAGTESLVIDGMHVYNSHNSALQLADSEPSVSWRVGNISAPGALAPGPMYVPAAAMGLSGRWDRGHLVLGSHHLWVDAAGLLRHKDGPPSGETDGAVIG